MDNKVADSSFSTFSNYDERLASSVKTILSPVHATIDPAEEPDNTHIYARNIPNVSSDMESTGTARIEENRLITEGQAYDSDTVKKFAEKKRSNTATIYLMYIVGVLILINIAVLAITKFVLR